MRQLTMTDAAFTVLGIVIEALGTHGAQNPEADQGLKDLRYAYAESTDLGEDNDD